MHEKLNQVADFYLFSQERRNAAAAPAHLTTLDKLKPGDLKLAVKIRLTRSANDPADSPSLAIDRLVFILFDGTPPAFENSLRRDMDITIRN